MVQNCTDGVSMNATHWTECIDTLEEQQQQKSPITFCAHTQKVSKRLCVFRAVNWTMSLFFHTLHCVKFNSNSKSIEQMPFANVTMVLMGGNAMAFCVRKIRSSTTKENAVIKEAEDVKI